MKFVRTLALLGCVAILTTSCVAGPNPLKDTPGSNGKVAGFFNGFWDGSIAPITLVVSWFNPNVYIYNPSSDGWYPLGFMLGVGGLAGSGTAASSKYN